MKDNVGTHVEMWTRQVAEMLKILNMPQVSVLVMRRLCSVQQVLKAWRRTSWQACLARRQ